VVNNGTIQNHSRDNSTDLILHAVDEGAESLIPHYLVDGAHLFSPPHNPMKRFKIYEKGPFKGYRMNRPLFVVIFTLCIALLVLTVAVDGVSFLNRYVSCPEDAYVHCENPFYGECDGEACRDEFLYPGVTYGEPPSFLYRNVPFYVIVLFCSYFFINHLLYNRKFKTEVNI